MAERPHLAWRRVFRISPILTRFRSDCGENWSVLGGLFRGNPAVYRGNPAVCKRNRGAGITAMVQDGAGAARNICELPQKPCWAASAAVARTSSASFGRREGSPTGRTSAARHDRHRGATAGGGNQRHVVPIVNRHAAVARTLLWATTEPPEQGAAAAATCRRGRQDRNEHQNREPLHLCSPPSRRTALVGREGQSSWGAVPSSCKGGSPNSTPAPSLCKRNGRFSAATRDVAGVPPVVVGKVSRRGKVWKWAIALQLDALLPVVKSINIVGVCRDGIGAVWESDRPATREIAWKRKASDIACGRSRYYPCTAW
jgi:hypothetical protein